MALLFEGRLSEGDFSPPVRRWLALTTRRFRWEARNAVVDRTSSAGLQDDRSLLPGQVSQVKDGISEAGRPNLKDVGVANAAVLGCYNAPISGGRDILCGSS